MSTFFTKIYSWINTPVPSPKTGNQAFNWFQELPLAQIETPGLRVKKQFFNVGAPQVMTQQTQTIAGLGGLQAGQYVSQGLVAQNPNNAPETG